MAENLFGAEVPTVLDAADSTPYTLGCRFTPQVNGTLTHYKWRVPLNAQTAGQTLAFGIYRNSDSQLLNSVSGISTVGQENTWIQVPQPGGQALLAGVAYTVVVFTPNRYTHTSPYTWPKNNGANLITAAPAGWYNGNFAMSFPNSNFNNANYFIDLVFEPAGGGTTPFTKDWSTTWNIRAAFTKDWSTSWRISNAWTKDWATTWAVSNAFVKDYADTWRISNSWSKDWADSWAVRAGFTKDWSATWRIANAWSKDWATTWRITNGWSKDYTDSWRVRNAWQKDWSDVYNVLTGTAWTKDWADTWQVRNAWQKDWSSSWRVLNGFTKDWSDSWVVRSSWQKDYATTWEILADTTWFKEWSSTWRIRNGWLKDYVTTWRILDDTPTPALPADAVARLDQYVSATILTESVRARL